MATTTNYSWTTPDNTAYVKDGASAIRTLGSSVDSTLFTALGGAYPGLRLIKKQTIGSAVSSVSVTSAFSATYDNYLIEIVGGVASTDCSLSLQLTGITTGYYTSLVYSTFGAFAPSAASNANQSSWAWAGGGTVVGLHSRINIRNPFQAIAKTGTNDYLQPGTAGQTGISRYYNASTSSATAFSITPSAGTMTGGTIYVYGYGIS